MIRKVFFFSLPQILRKDKEEHFVLSFTCKGFNIIKFYSESKEISLLGEYIFDTAIENVSSQKDVFHKFVTGLLSKEYSRSRVTCILQSDDVMLIPEKLYNPSKNQILTDAVYQKKKSIERIPFDDIVIYDNEKYVLVSHTPQWQYDFMQCISKEKVIRRHCELMLKTFFSKKSSDAIYLQVIDGFFYLLLFSNSKLIFFNSFHFQTSKDFCYFVIASLQANNISSDTTLYITGDIMAESEIMQLLKKYINSIIFLQTQHTTESKEISLHRFYTQLSL